MYAVPSFIKSKDETQEEVKELSVRQSIVLTERFQEKDFIYFVTV